jgi:succinate dehydrogenase flavin-adding protein (antitoxin of CptAB toxin-antitoxin module)
MAVLARSFDVQLKFLFCRTRTRGSLVDLNMIEFIASETKASSETRAVGRIGFVEMLDLQLLNALRNRRHTGDDIADQAFARFRRYQSLCGLERDRWRECRNFDARSTGVEASCQ